MASHSPPYSPSNRPRKSWARNVERCCCATLSFFPLAFVYGLTTWAVYVEVQISFLANSDLFACTKAALGVLLYGIANASYSVAVFTSAGSPLDPRQDLSLSHAGVGKKSAGGGRGSYDVLPTYEDEAPDSNTPGHTGITTVTAKSTGKQRYCKKCHTIKPDRTHHCSTCGRCVLKMDHHCPWLATCVGLRNYKPFLLFLIYTCLFCWLCFGVTASWVWAAMGNDERMRESMVIINTILLTVLSGIIGLVLTGFTGWHIYLAVTGQTTIESLEKTRYLNPLRRSMEATRHNPHDDAEGHHSLHSRSESESQGRRLLEHLKETHANALPGVLRPEEGDAEAESASSRSHTPQPPLPPSSSHQPHHAPTLSSSSSPAKDALQRSYYATLERDREHARYAAYLDEVTSEKLPNAFHLGWRRNLLHVFGSKPLLWGLPVCNTSGDGWTWDVSPQWHAARAEADREREARGREEAALREMDAESVRFGSAAAVAQGRRDYRWMGGQGFVSPNPQGDLHGRRSSSGGASGGVGHMQMQPLDRRKGAGASPPKAGREDSGDSYDTSSDEDAFVRRQQQGRQSVRANGNTANWNDIPDEFLATRSNGSANRSGSRGRPKGD